MKRQAHQKTCSAPQNQWQCVQIQHLRPNIQLENDFAATSDWPHHQIPTSWRSRSAALKTALTAISAMCLWSTLGSFGVFIEGSVLLFLAGLVVDAVCSVDSSNTLL